MPFDLLLEPLHYPFMRTGLLEVLLLGVASGLIGPFVVQRQLTFFGHALSHTIYPALVLAAVVHAPPVVAAMLGAVLTVGLVFALQHRRDIGQDSAVGIVFLGLFALGVVLVGSFRVRSADVGAAVVGSLLGVSGVDLAASAALVLILAAVVGTLYRPLVLASFDRLSAHALGLPVLLLDLLLLASIAAVAVVSVKAVGVILTVGVLVTPAAAARLWATSLPSSMLLSGVLCTCAGTIGLYAAYYLSIAPAALVVVALGVLFASSVGLRVALRGASRAA